MPNKDLKTSESLTRPSQPSHVGPISLSTRCNATKAVTNGGAAAASPATSQCSCWGTAPGSASSAVNSQSSAEPQRAVKRAPTGPAGG